MSFDFFNEGIKKQTGAEFTKEQEDFLTSKLPFLDPKKTSQIAIGTVLQLFNLTKINSAGIKKILQNCKIQGKKTLTYDEMKRVFRAISLAQKGIEPSAININANIKLPMPKFYEDEDSEQEEPAKPNPVKQLKPPVQPPPPPKSQTNHSLKEPSFAEFGQFVQPPKPQQQPKQEQPPPKQPPPQQQQQQVQRSPPAPQPEQGSSNKIKEFEAYWSRLNTNNNKIDGGEVKNLCKNLAQRSNLSKAWKLCCHTHSGNLTKGEFYVFLQLVSSHHQLPDGLTEQMKAIISKIDKGNQVQKEKERNVSQFSQLGSTTTFDNFGRSQLSISALPPPPLPLKPTNQPPQKSASNTLIAQTSSRLSGKLEAASKGLQSSQEASEQELLQLRRQQQAMNNMMGEVEQFLTQVNNKSNKMRAEIDELKNNQTTLNERFNKVCMAMNQIILRQNAFIDELANELAQQNRVNEQKATVLERYVEQREAYCQQMERRGFQQARKSEQSRQSANNSPVARPVKVEHAKQEHEDHQEQQTVPEFQVKQQKQERQSSPIHQQVESPAQSHQAEQQHTVQHHEEPHEPELKQEQEQLTKEQEQYMNRMRMKQMQVIQLIHYLTPISQEEYPKIAQKITSYSEDQLNFAYSGLYEKLLEKQRLEQQPPERTSERERPSVTGEDEFNTSNFKHEEKQEQAQGGQDFFS